VTNAKTLIPSHACIVGIFLSGMAHSSMVRTDKML
jgi:hypothetical protein